MQIKNRKVYVSQSLQNIGLHGKPWLHTIVLPGSQDFLKLCITFVWDTREIVECKEYSIAGDSKQAWKLANDNGQALQDVKNMLPKGLTEQKPPVDKQTKINIEFRDMLNNQRGAFINDVLVCKVKRGHDLYNKIVNGVPDKVRSVHKAANSTNWYLPDLAKALNGKFNDMKAIREICKDSYHDTKWGDTGHAMSDSAIRKAIHEAAKHIVY